MLPLLDNGGMTSRDGDEAQRHVGDEWLQMSAEIEEARRSRRELLQGRGAVVSAVEALLFRHDPIGINFGHNTDEYRPEAETVTIRLPEANSPRDVMRIVHEEFVHWFGASIAGPRDRYAEIADRVWAVWQRAGN